MTIEESTQKYPDLMAYIQDRNKLEKAYQWCDQLRIDERAAQAGELAAVAEQLKQAQADYGSYPYNSAMGEFLGLPLKGNNEPGHGYYMASGVKNHFALGQAQRRAKELIGNGNPIRVITARSRQTNEPIRFATFFGPAQILIEGCDITLNNGKKKMRFSSNWSVETAMQKLVSHLETGEPVDA